MQTGLPVAAAGAERIMRTTLSAADENRAGDHQNRRKESNGDGK